MTQLEYTPPGGPSHSEHESFSLLQKWVFISCRQLPSSENVVTEGPMCCPVHCLKMHRGCSPLPQWHVYAVNFPPVWSVLFTESGCGGAAFFFSFCESSFADGGRRMHMAAWPSRMTLGLEMNPTVTPTCCTISSRADSCGSSGNQTQSWRSFLINDSSCVSIQWMCGRWPPINSISIRYVSLRTSFTQWSLWHFLKLLCFRWTAQDTVGLIIYIHSLLILHIINQTHFREALFSGTADLSLSDSDLLSHSLKTC